MAQPGLTWPMGASCTFLFDCKSFVRAVTAVSHAQREYRAKAGDKQYILQSPILVSGSQRCYRPKEARMSKSDTTTEKTDQFYPLALHVGPVVVIFVSFLEALQYLGFFS